MGCMILKIFLVISFISGAWIFYKLSEVPPLPNIEKNPWWGPGDPKADNTAITPFTISVSDEDLADLKTRMSLPLRLTPGLENANFTYGFNPKVLKIVMAYWREKYNWREREKLLNSLPQFKTQIEGLDIHYLRVKPKAENTKNKAVMPLLLIHGWPGSVVEFYDIIPMLISSKDDSDVIFEVVCPSLPGYGFSDGSRKPGLGTVETAQIFLKLMKRLGFEKFYVQGGDWGAIVASNMATFYPNNIIGMHINMVGVYTPATTLKYLIGSYLPSGTFFDPEDEDLFYPVLSFHSYILRESGYMHLQSTKPDTIGVALGDSPAGLAAYLIEKFSSWTERNNPSKPDGGLFSPVFPISIDKLLDNLSLYWFTRSITTSMRYYAEHIPKMLALNLDQIPTSVPSGFSVFKHEIVSQPQNFIAHKYKNIISYVRHPTGGHFAAMEKPILLATDIHQFVTAVEKRTQPPKTEL